MKKLITLGVILIMAAWFAEPDRIVISGDDVVPILPPEHREKISSSSSWSVTPAGTPITFATTAPTGVYSCSTGAGSTTSVIVGSTAGSL